MKNKSWSTGAVNWMSKGKNVPSKSRAAGERFAGRL